MKTKTMTRILMAVAMLFAVQTSADAQLGGLAKKVKKAAEKVVKDPLAGTDNTTVVTTTTTTTTTIGNNEMTAEVNAADPHISRRLSTRTICLTTSPTATVKPRPLPTTRRR